MKKSTFTLLLASLFIVQGIAQQVEQKQRSLITKRTASWCPNCGTWGWTFFEDLREDNTDKALLIAAHYDGVLQSDAAEAITDNFGGVSQPRFYFNQTDVSATPSNQANVRNQVKDQVNAAFASVPLVNVGFEPKYQNGEIKVDAKVKFFGAASGEYYLGVYLLEDNVVAFQASIGNNANHMRVLRESFTSNTWGQQIVNGSATAGQEFDLSFALPIGDPTDYDYEVAGIIWEKEGNQYIPVNVWSTTQINTTTGADEAAAMIDFSVMPSVTSGTATAQLQLAENQPDASLDLFDVNGKLVANLYRGALVAGTQSFEISKDQAGGNGLFIIRLTSGSQAVARKVVFQ